MTKKRFLQVGVKLIIYFAIIFVSAVVVKLLWNYIFYDLMQVDWGASAALSVILAISFTIIDERKRTET